MYCLWSHMSTFYKILSSIFLTKRLDDLQIWTEHYFLDYTEPRHGNFYLTLFKYIFTRNVPFSYNHQGILTNLQ